MLTVGVHEQLNSQRLAHSLEDEAAAAEVAKDESKTEVKEGGEKDLITKYIHQDNKNNIDRVLGFLNLLCAFYQIALMAY